MSSAYDNVCKAAAAVSKAGIPHPGGLTSLFADPDRFSEIDAVREAFYTEEESRKIFDWVCQYRTAMGLVLGLPDVQLENTPFPPEKWAVLEDRAKRMTRQFVRGDYLLDRIDTWLLECYSLKGRCEVREGDVVLDCGTFTGNTSKYFSQKAGPAGHVYGFEPSPVSYKQYARNMAELKNVTPVNCAVSDKKEVLAFANDGACGASLKEYGETRVFAVDIDSFCRQQGVERVDFIKMDVEGAELAALRGARETIQKHRPRMALSAYHKEEDLLVLPAAVRELCPDYSFALRHFSACHYETVLYCW